jgi:hypothetical protein
VISTFIETSLDMHFRQDLPARKFSWGVDYLKLSQNITFRINEIDTYEEGPWLTVFAESTAIRGVKVRAYVENLLDSPFTRRREFFDGTRNGPLVSIEDRLRTRRRGPFWGVTISGTL